MVYVTRTNIDIDDDLLAQVMRRYDLPTKRAAVDFALRRLAVGPLSRNEALSREGIGWEGDLAAMRDEHIAHLPKRSRR
jgi:Arc/MetJ family transcription regulator